MKRKKPHNKTTTPATKERDSAIFYIVHHTLNTAKWRQWNSSETLTVYPLTLSEHIRWKASKLNTFISNEWVYNVHVCKETNAGNILMASIYLYEFSTIYSRYIIYIPCGRKVHTQNATLSSLHQMRISFSHQMFSTW